MIRRTGHPHGTTAFPDGALVSNQPYDISLIMHLPRTPNNIQAGNFMLDLSLLPATTSTLSSSLLPSSIGPNNDTIAQSRRAAILKYVSPIARTAGTLTFVPLYIFGFSQESETLTVPMFEGVEFANGAGNVPQAARVVIEADEKMQFYEARLRIIARLGGLRWLLYNHRIFSFLVFTVSFWGSSIISMGLVWLFLSIYLNAGPNNSNKGTGPKKEESDSNGSAIKPEPTPESEIFDPTSLEDLSDTARTFPTYGRQRPLQDHGPGNRDSPQLDVIKKEEDEPGLSAAVAAMQPLTAEADDEDDFEDAGGSWRDSGVGTSLDEERRTGVQRRRKAVMGPGAGR